MSELKSEIKDLNSVKKKIEITVPVERIRKVLEEVYKEIGKNAKLKGFRKGKVPRNMLEKYYSSEAHKEAVEKLVRETYPEALEKAGVFPISAPYVEPGSFDVEKPFSYAATFETRPEIELKEYAGLELEHPEVVVTEDDVNGQLERMRQQMAQLEPTGGEVKAENGMVLVLDFKGTAGDKPFKGSEAKDFLLELGAGNILPQFEEALSGTSKGEEKEFEFDYPADYYNKEVAGKHARFFIKVKDIKKKVIPELNDEFAKDLGDFKTLDEVKKNIEARITRGREREARQIAASQAIKQLVDKHPFEVPESMINSELKSMFESFIRHLASEGKKFEDTGMKIDDFIEKYRKDAEAHVRSFLVIDAISEVEKVSVTDSELEDRLKLIAQQVGQPLPKLRQHYEGKGLMGGLKVQLKHEKAVDLVVDKAKIRVKKAKKDKK